MLKLIFKIFLFLWLSAVIIGAFLYAPLAKGLGEYTRVLYFHVPMAWITVVAFLMSAIFSIFYLWQKNLIFDHYAVVSNQFGILFSLLATITGSIWAKVSWGAFWNWDPRETSIFILLLIYLAYFALRSAIELPDRRAALSAVYSLLAFVTVPFLIFIIPRVYSSLHPDPLINTEAKIQMDGRMLLVFMGALAGFSAFYLWMFTINKNIVQLRSQFEEKEF